MSSLNPPFLAASAKQTSNTQESAISASQLQVLTRDFSEVLSELHGDSSLVLFREEYEALFRALQQSHESESQLLGDCHALTGRIADSSTLVQQTVKEQHEQGNSVLMLSKSICDTQNALDSTNFRVQNISAARDALIAELANLATLRSTRKQEISDLQAAISTETLSISGLTQQIDGLVDSQRQQETEISRFVAEEAKIDATLVSDAAQMARLRETIRTKQEACETTDCENEASLSGIRRSRIRLDELTETLKRPTEDLAEFRLRTKVAKEEYIKAKKDAELLQNEAQRTESELARIRRLNQEQQSRLDRTQDDLDSQTKELHMLELKSVKEQEMVTALTTTLEGIQTEIAEIKEKTKTSQSSLDEVAKVVKMVETEVIELERLVQRNGSLLDEVKREKEALIAAAGLSDDKVNVVSELTEHFKRTVLQKEQENRNLQSAIDQLNTQFENLKADKKDFENRLVVLQQKQRAVILQKEKLDVDIKRREAEVNAIKEKISQQKHHCETVAREQLLISSTLNVSNLEVEELETKFDEINKKIKKMTEKVGTLDTSLVQTHLAKQKLTRHTEHLKDQVNRVLKKQQKLDTLLDDQSAASVQLDQVLVQGKRETHTQTHELNTLIHEREIITRQLSKRSNELGLLYEKIRIQQSLLVKGAARYRQLLADMDAVDHLLKQKTYSLNRISLGNKKLAELHNELLATQRQLHEEQSKSLLLSAELTKKVNVHAFRRLIEADPALYEVLQKIQALEKRIIARIDKISALQQARDALLDEIQETKVKIRRSRDLDELEAECRERKAYIEARNQQVQSLQDEVSSLRAKILDSKLDLAKLGEEKVGVMKKYFAGKAKERRLVETLQNESSSNSQGLIQGKLVTSIPRFTGGGFCLSRPE